MKNSSVLRYAGGKTRACKILMEVINKYFDLRKCKYLISPFFGGGSFEFHFQNMNPKIKIIANDKFTPLYNFWKEVKEDKNSLIEELKKIKNVKKEEFFNYRKEINYYNEDSKKQAIIYFIINRCSFSGTTFSGGFSEEASKKRFTLSSIEKIGNLDLSLIEFHNKDFSEFIIDDYNNDEYLMFLDPPYYLENSKLYGIKGDLHKDF
jgi:DNA adenine methylase